MSFSRDQLAFQRKTERPNTIKEKNQRPEREREKKIGKANSFKIQIIHSKTLFYFWLGSILLLLLFGRPGNRSIQLVARRTVSIRFAATQ